ncbi:hypothetical protein [Gordoniibacillus kamchatkensis]|uniref:hypothetical protein n=1 Tax=Gordoniibacillus kamchatkensis TaxID=1590651 RepID=UPI0012E06A37|nr:hypothetical protein [Paenibacillus sp. VKM B-2647]
MMKNLLNLLLVMNFVLIDGIRHAEAGEVLNHIRPIAKGKEQRPRYLQQDRYKKYGASKELQGNRLLMMRSDINDQTGCNCGKYGDQ